MRPGGSRSKLFIPWSIFWVWFARLHIVVVKTRDSLVWYESEAGLQSDSSLVHIPVSYRQRNWSSRWRHFKEIWCLLVWLCGWWNNGPPKKKWESPRKFLLREGKRGGTFSYSCNSLSDWSLWVLQWWAGPHLTSPAVMSLPRSSVWPLSLLPVWPYWRKLSLLLSTFNLAPLIDLFRMCGWTRRGGLV